jgi:uncharacterized protein YbcI
MILTIGDLWPERPITEYSIDAIGLRFCLFMLLRNPIILRARGDREIMESSIRNAIIKFEQEFMGRGPDDVRAFIVRDLVVVRLKGVLTPAERQLAKTAEGVDMVKRLRQNLIAQGRDKLCEQVSEITGAKILGVFTDIDVQLGERIFAFTVDRELPNGCR